MISELGLFYIFKIWHVCIFLFIVLRITAKYILYRQPQGQYNAIFAASEASSNIFQMGSLCQQYPRSLWVVCTYVWSCIGTSHSSSVQSRDSAEVRLFDLLSVRFAKILEITTLQLELEDKLECWWPRLAQDWAVKSRRHNTEEKREQNSKAVKKEYYLALGNQSAVRFE